MTPEERAQQSIKMEKLEAERDLVEGIRAGIAAAAKVKGGLACPAYHRNFEVSSDGCSQFVNRSILLPCSLKT